MKFFEHSTSFKVQALDEHFVILTQPRPFSRRGTEILYTIIDWRRGWRGPHNSSGYGAMTAEDIQEMLEALNTEEIELSRRSYLPLNIEWIEPERRYFHKNEEII